MQSLSAHDSAVLNCIFNPNLPLSDAYDDEVLSADIKDDEENSPEVLNSKSLEVQAVQKAETGDFEAALGLLNDAISFAPDRASLYNNRAQVYQLKNCADDAFDDLTKAIQFGENNSKRTLCQALCQRGLLHRKAGRVDLAKIDFEKAAKLGSQFAKSQLVELNPYAALCNQMLRKVMNELK